MQKLIENNLEFLLGVRFVASEYGTGKTHAGRIDSLGIDENLSPVIIEYKRSVGVFDNNSHFGYNPPYYLFPHNENLGKSC